MDNIEKLLKKAERPSIEMNSHKQSLTRALLNSGYFDEEKNNYFNRFINIMKIHKYISAGTAVGLTVVAAYFLTIFSPVFSPKLSTSFIITKAAEVYQEESNTMGRYLYTKYTSEIINPDSKMEFTEEVWEDTLEGNYRSKVYDNNQKLISEYALIAGKEYECKDCPGFQVESLRNEQLSLENTYIIIDDEKLKLDDQRLKYITNGVELTYEKSLSMTSMPDSFEIKLDGRAIDLNNVQMEINGIKSKVYFPGMEMENLNEESISNSNIWNQIGEITVNLNTENKSRSEIFDKIRATENVTYEGEERLGEKKAHVLKIVESDANINIASYFYFEVDTFGFVGTRSVVESTDGFHYETSMKIIEHAYSDSGEGVNFDGLTEVESEFENVDCKEFMKDAIKNDPQFDPASLNGMNCGVIK
jgi:hypothetical protein